ncbi:hypothetical protein GW17_00022205 [Ensete ventricosum]|nr:hypothetical protein GW17_00022205 [Ensete ventricosum]
MIKNRDRRLIGESAHPDRIPSKPPRPPKPSSLASNWATEPPTAHRDRSMVDLSSARYDNLHPPRQQKSGRASSLTSGDGVEELESRQQARPAPCPSKGKIWSPLLLVGTCGGLRPSSSSEMSSANGRPLSREPDTFLGNHLDPDFLNIR